MTNYDDRPGRVLPQGLSWGVFSWRNVHGQPNPSQIYSAEGWSLRTINTDVENGRVRWLYSSPEIEFECLGEGYDSTSDNIIPEAWRVICVGIVPGGHGAPRLPRGQLPLIEKHCRNVKRALPYWGTTRELGFMPEVRINDPYWPIAL